MSATPTTQRGQVDIEIPFEWRLDGALDLPPDAPLVLALHGQTMDQDRFAVLLQRLFTLPCRFLVPRGP